MTQSLPVYQPPSLPAEETMVVPVPSNLSELQAELVEKSKEILNLKDIIRIYESRHISVEENEKEHIKSKASIKIINNELMKKVEELENELSYKDKIIQNDKLVIDDLNNSLNRLVDEVQKSKSTESTITEQFNTLYQEKSQLNVVNKEYLNQISKLNRILEDKDKRLEELSDIIDKNMEMTTTLKTDNDCLKAANEQLQIEMNECQNKENKQLENLDLLNQQLNQKVNELLEENNQMRNELMNMKQQQQQGIVNPAYNNSFSSSTSSPLQQQQPSRQELQYQQQGRNLMNETIDQSIYEQLLSSLDILCKYTNTGFYETPLTIPIINNTLAQVCNVIKQRINTEKSLLMDGSDSEIASLNIKIAYEIKIHEFVKQMAELEGTIVELRTSQMNLLTELASYKEKEKLGLLSQSSIISDGGINNNNNNNNNGYENDERIKELNDSVNQLQEKLKAKEIEIQQLNERINNYSNENNISNNNNNNNTYSEDEMNELKNKLTTTQAELDRNKSMITSIEDQYSQQINEKDELIVKLNSELNNLKTSNSELSELSDKIMKLNEELSKKENELASKDQVIDRLKSDNSEINEMNEKIEKLNNDINQKENELTSKNQEIERLKNQLKESEELQQSMSSGSNEAMNTLQEQIKSKNNEIENKNNEIQSMNNEIENKNNEINSLNQTIEQLKQQNEEKDNQLSSQKAESDVLIDRLQKVEESNKKNNDEIERLNKIISDKNETIKSKDGQLLSLESITKDLRDKIKEQETIIEVENSAHSDEVKKLQSQLTQLEEAIKSNESDNLLTILQKCQETITTTGNELEKTKEIIQKYKDENDQLVNEKKELENQIEVFRNTPDNASAIIERLTKQNEEKDKQIEQLSKDNIPSPGFINEYKLFNKLQEKYNSISELIEGNESSTELVKEIPRNLTQIQINLQSQKDKVSEELVSYQGNVENMNNSLSTTIDSVNGSNCEKHDEIVSLLHDMKAETEPDLTYLSNIINELQSVKLE